MPIRVFHLDDSSDETTLFKLLVDGHDDIEHVGSVNDPAELLGHLTRLKPDVLVMDYRMGLDVDISALVRRIGSECPGTAVVCFTGYEHAEAVEAILAAGVVAHVAKGSPFEDVLGAIRSARGD